MDGKNRHQRDRGRSPWMFYVDSGLQNKLSRLHERVPVKTCRAIFQLLTQNRLCQYQDRASIMLRNRTLTRGIPRECHGQNLTQSPEVFDYQITITESLGNHILSFRSLLPNFSGKQCPLWVAFCKRQKIAFNANFEKPFITPFQLCVNTATAGCALSGLYVGPQSW